MFATFASNEAGDRIRLLMKAYHIAVVGATAPVGQELLRVLERRSFPVSTLRLIGSARSAGKSFRFRDQSIPVQELTDRSFDEIDIVFFSAGGEISRKYVPVACQAEAIAIDNSSVFRMEPHVPLVIPEINAEDARRHRGLIANPNCTTAVTLMALYPLHRAFGVRRTFAASYQAVSGSGAEEMKMQNEGRKIMHLPEFRASVTCVRVPVYRAHSVAVNAEFERPVSVEHAREVLAKAPGLELVDEPQNNRYPMPLSVAGKDNCEVGRVRVDCAFENGLSFWVSGDQLLKGAALNAVQIAELL